MPAPTGAALERFADLAASFLAAAERGDLSAMDTILARRRSLLGRIEGADAPERERSRELLERILELDRRAATVIAGQRDEVERELSRLDEGRRGLGAYGRSHARSAKWIDARG